MTEEERFQAVKNIYMNYEHELAQRGMENVAPIASSLTTAYVLHALLEGMHGESEESFPVSITVDEMIDSINMFEVDSNEEWDSQP